jgi:diphthine synthase
MCGLQHYKFGRTTTLVFPQGNYFPESPYEIIGQNLKDGLHTLVLLEYNLEDNMIMTAKAGLKLLLDLENRTKKGHISEESLVCVIARAGSHDNSVSAGKIKDLLGGDFGEPMHCLIIPGKLHFMEAEALVKLCGAPDEILEEAD